MVSNPVSSNPLSTLEKINELISELTQLSGAMSGIETRHGIALSKAATYIKAYEFIFLRIPLSKSDKEACLIPDLYVYISITEEEAWRWNIPPNIQFLI
jgi:hypothetical protein